MTIANSSLVIVGTGIKFIAHLTTEAKAYIQQSDKVLYLVNDPAMKEWISINNKNAESLDPIYFNYAQRKESYCAITDYILEILHQNIHLCVVLYGHPAIFASPALAAAHIAKTEGYYTRILPGISAEDCLFADLLIDPGTCGCQTYEATDFLIYKRQFNVSSHLILWQVGMLGATGFPKDHDNSKNARILKDYLAQYYPPTHETYLYEGAQYAMFEPRIDKVIIHDLAHAKYSSLTTLYIPPAETLIPHHEMLNQLGITLPI